MSRPPFTDRTLVRRTVSLRLPGHLIDRARELARQHNGSLTDLVETALQNLIDATAVQR